MLSTDVRAGSVNGEISTDFPIRVVGNIERRRVEGTIGAAAAGWTSTPSTAASCSGVADRFGGVLTAAWRERPRGLPSRG